MERGAVPDRLFIGGEWRDSADGALLEVIDPATEETVARVPRATSADLDDALAAADEAFDRWRNTDAWSRCAVLRRTAEIVRAEAGAMAEVLTAEQGKPLSEARGEVLAAADQFDWYADEARRIYGRTVDAHSTSVRILVLRQPIGPVAAFTPWNFPALLPARKLAPAVAAGCSVILKPAEEAPRTALLLASALVEAGLPPGVVNVVTGEPALVSEHLIRSDVIRKVTLTGSVPVGRRLLRLAAEGIKAVTLELGGHAPVLVFDDADVPKAAEVAVRAKFRNCGQVCISPSRFYVQEAVAGQFTSEVVDMVAALRLGRGAATGTEVGPLSNQRRRDAVEALVADAVAKGATVAYGGRRPPGAAFQRGFWYEPTVLTEVTPDMELMGTEPFGPILPISTFTELEDALAAANSTPYGLAGYVFTESTRRAFLAAEGLRTGMVGVNNLVIATAEAPFGGVGSSGFGREGGTEGIDAYLDTKYVNLEL